MSGWMDRYGMLLECRAADVLVAAMLYAVTRGDRSSLSRFSRVAGYGWCIAVMVGATVATVVTRP